jgi:hypothetical protein
MGTFENIYELQRLWAPPYYVRLELRDPCSCAWTVHKVSDVTGKIVCSWADHDLDGLLETLVREHAPKPSTFTSREILRDLKYLLEKYS